MLWSKRPISQELLYAEVFLWLLLLADKLTVDLGNTELKLLSALSAACAEWYWDPAYKKGCVSNYDSAAKTLETLGSGSWLLQLFVMACSSRSSQKEAAVELQPHHSLKLSSFFWSAVPAVYEGM
ncbi:TPA: hypothetical protein ACH3X1_015938 [Trebouxia sp. C0004]